MTFNEGMQIDTPTTSSNGGRRVIIGGGIGGLLVVTGGHRSGDPQLCNTYDAADVG